MSQAEEFQIKGAAEPTDLSQQSPAKSADQPEKTVENADSAEKVEEVQGNEKEVDEGVENGQGQGTDGEGTDEEKNLQKYKWYKCENPQQGPGVPAHYYTNTETGESSWTEPTEPYWLYNVELVGPDPCGLQYPPGVERPTAAQSIAEAHPLAYNPKIHGNYDPNADYAKYTEQRLNGNNSATTLPGQIPGAVDYSSTMALNARTGSAQPAHLTADRHNDAAKSGRQMNAFFDVDAAANAHEGKSLKEERKNKKLSKAEVKAFNEARKEKKQKKRMAFYKS
ncbi:Putative WW domain-containing protein [Septoria linicola]|uniref:WW domain-containing protein n=1 Tax=Septoria linicola TaxID=215465 RepID=A0A9Q9AL82_9PEZI|nr:Putative WW domain-containing protein [Septoria linicola]